MLEKKSFNLEYYFAKIQQIVADKSSNNVSSRVRFLLQDIIDMQENGRRRRRKNRRRKDGQHTQDIKLHTTENAWKPEVEVKKATSEEESEDLIKKELLKRFRYLENIKDKERFIYDRAELYRLKESILSQPKPAELTDEVIAMIRNGYLMSQSSKSMSGGAIDSFLPSYAASRGPPGMQGVSSASRSIHQSGSQIYSGRLFQDNRTLLRKIISSLSQDVNLHTTENAWKPEIGVKKPTSEEYSEELATKELLKRFRGYLNKITPQKYDVIEGRIRELKIDTEDRLKRVLDLIFDKAVDEPAYCIQYANLCRYLGTVKVQDKDENGQEVIVEFWRLFLTRCQQEFEKNVYEGLDLEGREAAIAATEDIEKKKILQAELEEDKRRARRKSLGNMKLVGELYRLQMLKGFIVLNCVNELCSDIEDETLECLCILLKTIGQQLETEMLEKKSSNLEYYFEKIRKIVADKSSNNVSSRVRFLLQDIIDMRENGWQERAIYKDNKPKTIDQIHEEAAIQEKQNLDDNYRRRRRRRNRRRKDGQHTKRLQQIQQEMMRTQRKYQKELEKLEQDNKVLRQQLLLMKEGKPTKKVKKSLIDLYSEVLDELSAYDTTQTQDHLPKVIVVGDQSAGKTSALEMIAQARIFPRGAGEMMTRAPVEVTLSEAPNHVSFFKDSTRVYDLMRETELADLRDEIEKRMTNSVRGKSISSEVISLTVQGPGIKRMVLVDLPGVISTITTEMSKDTREAIKGLTKTYTSNPNAIILCIQDGSLDVDRSITDLVSEMDAEGKRTIFVLTKVDVAEKNMVNPKRIKKILDGKLFPMKALGYFACVTGKGSKNDTIDEIQSYEEDFFRKSRLCKNGILKASQCTTQNLSLAVSECFWKIVKASVEEQAKTFEATRFDLETEWKNLYPHQRQLTRDELFEKARGEILDDLIKLTNYSPVRWENVIFDRFWDKISSYFFDQVYMPAAQTPTSGTFNTQIDINIKQWADGFLSGEAIEVGWETLRQEFTHLIDKSNQAKCHDNIIDQLKKAVAAEALKRHKWDLQSAKLKIIQMNSLEDRSIPDQISWYTAVSFLEKSLSQRLVDTEERLYESCGPSWLKRWSYWKWKTPEQTNKSYIKCELERLLMSSYQSYQGHLPSLSKEEITIVRKNLQAQNIEVDSDSIMQVWFLLSRQQFLKSALERAGNCRSAFQSYQRTGSTEGNHCNCNDVILFWRLNRMMKTTANTLRQNIMNIESKRLESEIKDTLDDFSVDEVMKESLLNGRRVILAEEIRKVKQIQDKLRVFIEALNQEKS